MNAINVTMRRFNHLFTGEAPLYWFNVCAVFGVHNAVFCCVLHLLIHELNSTNQSIKHES